MAPSFDISIVIVHYRTPELVGPCVAALRRDLEAASAGGPPLRAEWRLVDNGSGPGDRRSFRELGLEVVDPGRNVGYAGGANRGFGAATADRLVLLNPDVQVSAGCLDRLLAALDAGYAAAGPRFSWDRDGRLLLPPNEPRHKLWELQASLAQGSPTRARSARRAWRRHARRHWTACANLPSYELSGALLALRRDAWERIGPFDESYALYFEETDWLQRLRRSGGRAAYVPAARAIHLYDQSARREPQAEGWFAASRRRFLDVHHGSGFRHLLEALERRSPPAEPPALPPGPEPPRLSLEELTSGAPSSGPGPSPGRAGVWVEISPRYVGFPAAAERLSEAAGEWVLPREVWDRMSPGAYWLRVVDHEGRERSVRAFSRS